jgi:O-antigen ligase
MADTRVAHRLGMHSGRRPSLRRSNTAYHLNDGHLEPRECALARAGSSSRILIQVILAYIVLALIVIAILWTPVRPSIAVGLFIAMYGSEQVLAASIPSIANDSALFNFIIGGVGAIAIATSIFRYGLPRLPFELLVAFSIFFFLIGMSLAWTTGPILGSYWVTHFAAEIPLAILLPITTIRRFEDLKPLAIVLILLSLCVALGVVASPIISSYSGRTYLNEGGTVLSPAELTGLALIFACVLDGRFLGVLRGLRIPIAVVLALGTLLSGARGQFLLAVGLVTLVLVARRYSNFVAGIAFTIGLLLIAVPIAFVVIFSDLALPSFRASERFTEDSLRAGLELRFEMIEKSITLESPIFGNGVGSWSKMHNQIDSIPANLEAATLHPHNSLAQVYYELGIVGLLIFLWILSIGIRLCLRLYALHANDPPLRSTIALAACYFVYSFLLSMKQSTFLAAIGIYLSIALLCALGSTLRSPEVASSSVSVSAR